VRTCHVGGNVAVGGAGFKANSPGNFGWTFWRDGSKLAAMALPYKISTLLYCFNAADEALLMLRNKEPNRGLWSPCGGKLDMALGESPYACACREASEEIGMELTSQDLHLNGLISEHGYEGQAHWLMFLFEIKPRLAKLPKPHREGEFAFFSAREISSLPIPRTDAEQIWPLFWRHRGGFFSAHCHCLPDGRNRWTLEEARCGEGAGGEPR
jgi:8-oxo-dGTP diphosphatase